jgi:hypothetical protein
MKPAIAVGAALVLAAAYFSQDHHRLPAEPGTVPKLPVVEVPVRQSLPETGVPQATPPAAPVVTAAGPDCTVVENFVANPDGTATPLYSCQPARVKPPHPYTGYSTEALASLAYADADAARILGMRLRHDDETAALSLIVRASALAGGDPAAILEYANAYPRPSAIDGSPVRKTVHVQFVLGSVADMLGAGASNVAYWEARIREKSADADREIDLLRKQARAIVVEMQRIQLDVTGSTDVGGPDDA